MSEPPSSRDAVGTRKGPFRFPGFPAGPFQPSLVGLAAALLVSCGGQAGWMSFNDGYAETGPLGVGVSVTGVVRSADTARHDETRLGDATFTRFGVFAGGAAPDYWLWPRDEGVALEVQFAGYVDDEGFPSEYWRLAFPMVSLGERRPGMPGAASKGWTGRSHGALVGLGVTYVRKHGGGRRLRRRPRLRRRLDAGRLEESGPGPRRGRRGRSGHTAQHREQAQALGYGRRLAVAHGHDARPRSVQPARGHVRHSSARGRAGRAVGLANGSRRLTAGRLSIGSTARKHPRGRP